jgi:hypothetical protein
MSSCARSWLKGQKSFTRINDLKARAGAFTGTLAEGDITASTLVGSLQGRTVGELVEDINNGQCYVNVHTSANPGGEIRGIILLS